MNIKCEFSYNGTRQERKIPGTLHCKILDLIRLQMPGEYRCACQGLTDIPLGIFYYGNQSNPEWIVTLTR